MEQAIQKAEQALKHFRSTLIYFLARTRGLRSCLRMIRRQARLANRVRLQAGSEGSKGAKPPVAEAGLCALSAR